MRTLLNKLKNNDAILQNCKGDRYSSDISYGELLIPTRLDLLATKLKYHHSQYMTLFILNMLSTSYWPHYLRFALSSS